MGGIQILSQYIINKKIDLLRSFYLNIHILDELIYN